MRPALILLAWCTYAALQKWDIFAMEPPLGSQIRGKEAIKIDCGICSARENPLLAMDEVSKRDNQIGQPTCSIAECPDCVEFFIAFTKTSPASSMNCFKTMLENPTKNFTLVWLITRAGKQSFRELAEFVAKLDTQSINSSNANPNRTQSGTQNIPAQCTMQFITCSKYVLLCLGAELFALIGIYCLLKICVFWEPPQEAENSSEDTVTRALREAGLTV